MVIAAGRLDDVVPLEPASMPGRVVVQWDKDDCADLGIIKVDLLGLGMMAVLEDVIPLIREHEGVEVDLAKLPPDDPKTYAMLRRADTIGVFQVESRAQMATLPRLKPERFYDLVVEVALIRPGPIVGQMVHPYLNRRNGREPVTYAHPDLEPILKRTLGVPLFQEQLLRMAMVLAGFTGGEAEELRRAMGFKRSVARMEEIEARLRAGMTRRGIGRATQDEIVRSITSFALYGFPESHAASFALIAYASAYLRAHHHAAFVCALLNNWPMGFYHPATLVKDAQRHGVHVLPVDITQSSWGCTLEDFSTQRRGDAEMIPEIPPPCQGLPIFSGTQFPSWGSPPPWPIPATGEGQGGGGLPDRLRLSSSDDRDQNPLPNPPPFAEVLTGEGNPEARRHSRAFPSSFIDSLSQGGTIQLAMRLGLKYVRGLRAEAGQRIEAERARAPFTSVADVAARCGLRDDELQTLAHAGVFAPFGLTRREALWQASAVPKEPLLRQPLEPSASLRLCVEEPGLPEMSPLERSLADYKDLGLTVGPHVVRYLREDLRRQGVLSAAELGRARHGQWVRIGGLVIVRQRPGTAKGMCFLTIEDETGTANAAVLPEVFEEYRALLHTAALLRVDGPLQKVDGVTHVLARRLVEIRFPEGRGKG
jgi:error-prone DNA polymerase